MDLRRVAAGALIAVWGCGVWGGAPSWRLKGSLFGTRGKTEDTNGQVFIQTYREVHS